MGGVMYVAMEVEIVIVYAWDTVRWEADDLLCH